MSQRIYVVECFYECIEGGCIWKWTKINRTVFQYISCFIKARKFFPCYFQDRVGFAVFKADVVPRVMLLDEVVFQKECLIFVSRGNIFNGSGPADEEPGFNVLVSAEIGCEPVLQILGFSDIDYCSAFVAPHVDSALIWSLQCSLMKDYPWGKRFR